MSNEDSREFETSSNYDDERADASNELQQQISRNENESQQAIMETLESQTVFGNLSSTSRPVFVVGEKYFLFI